MSTDALPMPPIAAPSRIVRRENIRAFFGGPLTARGVFDRMAAVADDWGTVRLPHARVFFLNHPELIQECLVTRHRDFHKDKYYRFLALGLGKGLLTSEDDFHLRQRRMIQPVFHKERIQGYGETMARHGAEAAQQWQDGQQVDMLKVMNALTLKIVAKTLFNSDVAAESDMISRNVESFMHRDKYFMPPGGPLLFKLPWPFFTKFRRRMAEVDSVMFRMIDEHRASGDQGDLLSMLLEAQDTDDSSTMSLQQVRDEAMTLFLAGHETTALALTWAFYCLSQQPEAAGRVQEELDTVLGDRPPTAADYGRLAYTRMFIAEVMRLYPPAYMIARQAVRDTELGGRPVAKGGLVAMGAYFMHRNPRFWPDPTRFDPERFTPENTAARHKFAYFPFGGGRRLCIGEGFAWMEAVLVFAALAQHWTATLAPTHKIDYVPKVTLRPKNGMPMTLHRRTR